jgi:hypothetical protein
MRFTRSPNYNLRGAPRFSAPSSALSPCGPFPGTGTASRPQDARRQNFRAVALQPKVQPPPNYLANVPELASQSNTTLFSQNERSGTYRAFEGQIGRSSEGYRLDGPDQYI